MSEDEQKLAYDIAKKVWDRYKPMWRRRLDEDDSIQDAVIACMRQTEKHDPARAGMATFYWLVSYSSMRGTLKSVVRQKRGGGKNRQPLHSGIADEAAGPEELAELQDDLARLQVAIEDLSPRLRQTVLDMLAGTRVRRLASKKKVTVQAVYMARGKALDCLRERLS